MRRLLSAPAILLLAGCGPPKVWTGLSPDHGTRYDVSRRAGATCVRIQTRVAGCYDAVALSAIVFSPDSRSIAYPARVDGRWHVVRDGRFGPPVDEVGALVPGATGRLAYEARLGDAWYVVSDDRFSAPFDSVIEGSITFDPEGRRLAYAALRDARALVFVDGRPIASHDGVERLRFSPGGGPLASVAREGSTVSLRVGGYASPAHDAIPEYGVGPGGEVAYIARGADAWWVVGPDGRWGPFLAAHSLYFEGPGSLTFVARADGGERVFHRGTPGAFYGEIEPPVVVAGGRHWGYVGHDSVRSVVVLDGLRHSDHEWAGDLALDAAGRRFAFVSRRNDSTYVVDDRGAHAFDLVVDGTLQFTSTGCWAGLVGRWHDRSLFVVVEGNKEARRFDWWEFTGVVLDGPFPRAEEPGTARLLRSWVAAEAELIVRSGGGEGSQAGPCG